jgi:hypothetical protein
MQEPETIARIWKVELENAEPPGSPVGDWHLESPAAGTQVAVGQADLGISVWAVSSIPDAQRLLRLVVRLQDRTLSLAPAVERPDVVEVVLKAPSACHPQLKCGYRLSVPVSEAVRGFGLGFETDGLIHPAARVSIDTP